MSKQEDATLGLSVDITVDTESVSEITTETVGVIEATFKGISLAIKNGLQNVTATTNKSIADLHTQLMQQSTTIAKTATETKALMATGPLNFGGLDTRISELTAKLGQLTTGIANFSASMPTEPIRNLPNEDARALTNNSHALEQILVSIQKAVPNMLTAVSKTRVAETPKDELFNAVKNITTATMELQKELKQIPVALATNKMSMAVRPLQQSIIHYEANETELRSIVSRILDSTSKTVTEANKELLRSLMGTYGHNVQEVIVRFTDALAVEALKTLNSTAKKAEDQLTTCFKTTNKLLNTMGTIALAITQKGDVVAGSNYKLKYYNEEALIARNSDVKTVLQTVHTSITNPEVKVSTQDIVVRAIDAQTKEYTKCLRTELVAMGKELGATFKDSYELCKACGGGNKYHGETTVLAEMQKQRLSAYASTMVVAGHKLSCDGCLAEMKKAGVQNAIAVVDPYVKLDSADKWTSKAYLINKMQYELLNLVQTLQNIDKIELLDLHIPTEELLTKLRAAKQMAQSEGLYRGVFQINVDTTQIDQIPLKFAKKFGEHVTLSFNEFFKDIDQKLLGKTIELKIKGVASNDKIQAAVIELPEGITSKNEIPHIILSAAQGVKPAESNDMLKGKHEFRTLEQLSWDKIRQGTIDEIDKALASNGHIRSIATTTAARGIQTLAKEYDQLAPSHQQKVLQQLDELQTKLKPHGLMVGYDYSIKPLGSVMEPTILKSERASMAQDFKYRRAVDEVKGAEIKVDILDKNNHSRGFVAARPVDSNTKSIWYIDLSELADEFQGFQVGKKAYAETIRQIKLEMKDKPFTLIPGALAGADTSEKASRVWNSEGLAKLVAPLGVNFIPYRNEDNSNGLRVASTKGEEATAKLINSYLERSNLPTVQFKPHKQVYTLDVIEEVQITGQVIFKPFDPKPEDMAKFLQLDPKQFYANAQWNPFGPLGPQGGGINKVLGSFPLMPKSGLDLENITTSSIPLIENIKALQGDYALVKKDLLNILDILLGDITVLQRDLKTDAKPVRLEAHRIRQLYGSSIANSVLMQSTMGLELANDMNYVGHTEDATAKAVNNLIIALQDKQTYTKILSTKKENTDEYKNLEQHIINLEAEIATQNEFLQLDEDSFRSVAGLVESEDSAIADRIISELGPKKDRPVINFEAFPLLGSSDIAMAKSKELLEALHSLKTIYRSLRTLEQDTKKLNLPTNSIEITSLLNRLAELYNAAILAIDTANIATSELANLGLIKNDNSILGYKELIASITYMFKQAPMLDIQTANLKISQQQQLKERYTLEDVRKSYKPQYIDESPIVALAQRLNKRDNIVTTDVETTDKLLTQDQDRLMNVSIMDSEQAITLRNMNAIPAYFGAWAFNNTMPHMVYAKSLGKSRNFKVEDTKDSASLLLRAATILDKSTETNTLEQFAGNDFEILRGETLRLLKTTPTDEEKIKLNEALVKFNRIAERQMQDTYKLVEKAFSELNLDALFKTIGMKGLAYVRYLVDSGTLINHASSDDVVMTALVRDFFTGPNAGLRMALTPESLTAKPEDRELNPKFIAMLQAYEDSVQARYVKLIEKIAKLAIDDPNRLRLRKERYKLEQHPDVQDLIANPEKQTKWIESLAFVQSTLYNPENFISNIGISYKPSDIEQARRTSTILAGIVSNMATAIANRKGGKSLDDIKNSININSLVRIAESLPDTLNGTEHITLQTNIAKEIQNLGTTDKTLIENIIYEQLIKLFGRSNFSTFNGRLAYEDHLNARLAIPNRTELDPSRLINARKSKEGDIRSQELVHVGRLDSLIDTLKVLRTLVDLKAKITDNDLDVIYSGIEAVKNNDIEAFNSAIRTLTTTSKGLIEAFEKLKTITSVIELSKVIKGISGEVAANLLIANTPGMYAIGKTTIASKGSKDTLEGGFGLELQGINAKGEIIPNASLMARFDTLLVDMVNKLLSAIDVKAYAGQASASQIAANPQLKTQFMSYMLSDLPIGAALYRDGNVQLGAVPYTREEAEKHIVAKLNELQALRGYPTNEVVGIQTKWYGGLKESVQSVLNMHAVKTETIPLDADSLINRSKEVQWTYTQKPVDTDVFKEVNKFLSGLYNVIPKGQFTETFQEFSPRKIAYAGALIDMGLFKTQKDMGLDGLFDVVKKLTHILSLVHAEITPSDVFKNLVRVAGNNSPTIAQNNLEQAISSIYNGVATRTNIPLEQLKNISPKDVNNTMAAIRQRALDYVVTSTIKPEGGGLPSWMIDEVFDNKSLPSYNSIVPEEIQIETKKRLADNSANAQKAKTLATAIGGGGGGGSNVPPNNGNSSTLNPPSGPNGDDIFGLDLAREYRMAASHIAINEDLNGSSFESLKAKAAAAATEVQRLIALITNISGKSFLDSTQKDFINYSEAIRNTTVNLDSLKQAKTAYNKSNLAEKQYERQQDIVKNEINTLNAALNDTLTVRTEADTADLKSALTLKEQQLGNIELKLSAARLNKVLAKEEAESIQNYIKTNLATSGRTETQYYTSLVKTASALAGASAAQQKSDLYDQHLEDIYRAMPETKSDAYKLQMLQSARAEGLESGSRVKEIQLQAELAKQLTKEYANLESVYSKYDSKIKQPSDSIKRDIELVKKLEGDKKELELAIATDKRSLKSGILDAEQTTKVDQALQLNEATLEKNAGLIAEALVRIKTGLKNVTEEANKAKLSLADALKQDHKDNIAKKIEDLTEATKLYQAKVKAGIATPIDRIGNATNLYELAKLGQGSVETTFADLLAQENKTRYYTHSRAAGVELTDIKAKLQTQFGYTPDSTFSSLLTDYAGIRGRSMMNLTGTSISATGSKVDSIEQDLKELQRIEKEIQDAKNNKDSKTEADMRKSWNKKLIELDKQMADLKTHLDAEFVISLTPKVRKELFDKAITEALQPLQRRKQELDADFNNNLMSPDKYRELLSTNKKIAELQGVGYADALIASLQPAKSVTTNQTANDWLRKNNFGQFAQSTNVYQDFTATAQSILSSYARTLNPQDTNLTALANRTNEINAAQADLDRYKLTPNLSDKDKANQKSLEDKLITLRKEAEELAKKVATDFEIAKQESLNPTNIANKHADATAELKKNLEYQRDILLAEQATLGSTNERVNKLKELNVQLAKIEGVGLADSILRTLAPVTNSTKGIQAQEWLANNFAQGGFKPQNAYQRVTTAASPILQSYANMLAQTSDSKDELSRTLNRIASRTNGVNELQKNLETYKGDLSPEDELNKSDIEAKIAKLKNKLVKDIAKLNDLFDAATNEALDPNKIRKNLNTANTELERELKLRRDILVVEQAITGGDANRAREIANINSQLNALKGTGYANDILKGLAPTKSVTTGLTSQQWLRNNGFSQFADQMNTPYIDAFNTAKPILNNYSNMLAGQSPSQDRLSTTLTDLARYTNEITALQNRLEHPDVKGTNEEKDLKNRIADLKTNAAAAAANVNPLMNQALQDSLDPTKTNTRLTQQIADLTKSLEIEKQILDVEKDTGKQTAERAARLQQVNEQLAIIKSSGLAAVLDLQRGKTEHPLQGILGTNAAYNIAKTAGLNANGITFDRTTLAEQKQHELQKLLATYGQFDAVIAQNTKMSRTDILMHGIAGNNAAIADYQKQLNMAEHTLLKDPGNKEALSIQQQMKAAIQDRITHQEKLWQLAGKALQKEQETEKSLDHQVKIENDLLNVKKQQLERDLAIAKIHAVAGTGGTAQENIDRAKKLEDELARLNKRKPIAVTDVDKSVNELAKSMNITPQGESKGARGFAEQVMNMGTWWAEWTIGQQVMQVIPNALSTSISFAKEFEAIMKNVELITQANKVQFEQLVHTVAGLSNTTIFNPKELADGLVILGQAGFTAAESMKLLPNIAQLATATLSSLKTAADIATTAIEAFNIPVENSGMLTNTLAAITIESKLELESLGTTFNYIAESAAAAGLSIEQTGTAMGIMSNAGVRASTIGTSLRSILGTLMAPTEKFKAELGKVGLSVEDVNPRYRELGAILNDLRSKGFNVQEAFQGLDKRIAGAITSLIQNSENYTEFIGKITGTSRATTMAEGQMDTFDAQAKRLKNNALLLGGEAFMPALEPAKEMTRALAGITHALTVVMNTIPPSVRSFIGFGAAVGVGATAIKALLEGMQLILGVKAGTGFFASFGAGAANLKDVLSYRNAGKDIKEIDVFKNAGPVHQQFLGLLASLFNPTAWLVGAGITAGILTTFATVRELSGKGEQERTQRKAAESEAYAQELNLYSDILSKANTSSVLYAETLDTLAKKYGILSSEALKYAVIVANIAAKEDQKQATIASAKQPISWFENLTTFAEESKQKQAKLSADAQIDLLKQAGVYYTGTDNERLAVLNSAGISGDENELAKRARLLVNRTINEDMSAQDIAAKQLAEAKKNVKDLYTLSQVDPQKSLNQTFMAANTYFKYAHSPDELLQSKMHDTYRTAVSGISSEAQAILDIRHNTVLPNILDSQDRVSEIKKLADIANASANPESDKELYEALNRTPDEIVARQRAYLSNITEYNGGLKSNRLQYAFDIERNMSKASLQKLGYYNDSGILNSISDDIGESIHFFSGGMLGGYSATNKNKAIDKLLNYAREKKLLEKNPELQKSASYEEMEKLLAIDTQEDLARKRDEKASEYFYYKGQKTGFMVSGAQGAAVKDMEKQLATYRALEEQLAKQKAGAGTAADIDLTTEQIKDQEAALKQLAITGMKLLATKNMDFSGFKGIPQGVIQSIEKYIGAINTGINSGGLTGTDIFRKQFENLKALSGVAASDLPELGNKIDAINTKYKQLMADSPLAGKPKKLADGTIQNMSRDNEVHLALKARWDIEIEETIEQTALAGWQRLEPKVKAITDILQQNMNSKRLNLELGLDIRKADINIAAAQHSIDYMKSSHLTTSDWGGYLSGSVNTPIILAGGKDQALEQELNRKKETDLAIATFTAAQERYRIKQQELMESYIINFATATNLPGIDEGKKRLIYNYGGLVDTDDYTEKAVATRQALLAMGDRSGIDSTQLIINNIEKRKVENIAKNKKDKVSNLTESGLTIDQQKAYDTDIKVAKERMATAEAELEKAKTTPITYGQEKQPVDVKNKFEKLREQYLNAKEINGINNTEESRKVLKAIEKDYLEADMAYKQPLSELKRLDSGIWARKDSSAIDVQDLMTLISSGEIGHTALTKQMDNMAFAQWDEANKARSAAQDAILAAQKRGNVSPEELATLKAAEEAARNEVEIANAKGQKILDMKRRYVDQALAMEKELAAGISQAAQSEITIRKQAQEQIEQRKQFQATVRTDNEIFQADISKRLPGYSAPNTDKRIAAMAEMFDKASASFNNGREDEGKKYYQAARSMADSLKSDQSLSEQEIQRVAKVHSEGTYAVDSIQDRLNQRTAEQAEEQSKPFRAALEKSKIELKKRVDETMGDVESDDAERRNTALAYRAKLAKVESYTNATGEDIMKLAQDKTFSETINPNNSDLFGESTKKFADAVASFVEVFKMGKQPIDNEKKDPTATATDANTKGTIEIKMAPGTEGALTNAIVGAMSGKFIPTSDLTGLGS